MRFLNRTVPVRILLLWLLLLWSTGAAATPEVPPTAFAEGAVDRGEARVETRLLTDVSAVALGDELRVGVLFTMDPDWHIYWRNSGQSGLPTEVAWQSEQVETGPLQWPAPHIFSEADGFIITYGYGDSVLLFAEARATSVAQGGTEGTGDAAAAGSVQIVADVDYLACAHTCIPGRATLTVDVPVTAASSPAADDVVALFDEAQALVPRDAAALGWQLDTVISQEAVRPGDQFTAALAVTTCVGPPAGDESCPELSVPAEGVANAFISAPIDSVYLDATAHWKHPTVFSGTVVQLTGEADIDDPGGDQRLAGVLFLETDDGETVALTVDAPLPRAGEDAAVEPVESILLAPPPDAVQAPPPTAEAEPQGFQISIWKALLFALLGGLILNIMPCVFPVLSLKVFAFVETVHKGRQTIVKHAAAYTAGILATMWALGGVIIGVQAAGNRVGWGFQFQSPLFIAIISAVLVVFALNLFGVFEIGVRASTLGRVADESSGLRKSFFEGILAVVLATPCSAPFLGTASGFALGSSPLTILAIFSAIGLGLALPFVVLTLVPGSSRLLPKPGNWMNVFKQFLAFALLGTVVWLLWIIGETTGVSGMTRLIIFLLAVGLATWLYGNVQLSPPRWRWVGLAAALAIIAAVGIRMLHFEFVESSLASEDSEIQWESWTEQGVARELGNGRPVFVDFTATWCLTCKVNEEMVIQTDDVIGAVSEYDVAMFVGDWSQPDERIAAKLAEFGRGGVPMYLVYSPHRPDEPVLLPEVITVGMLIDALREAAQPDPI